MDAMDTRDAADGAMQDATYDAIHDAGADGAVDAEALAASDELEELEELEEPREPEPEWLAVMAYENLPGNPPPRFAVCA